MAFHKRRLSFVIHKSVLLFIALVIFFAPAHKPLMAKEVEEYSVKAAFILNFIKFTNWPTASFANADDPYQLCIMGNNAMVDQFKTINGKKIENRPLQVTQLLSSEGCRPCDIIFISRDTPRSVSDKIISNVKGTSVLTIGETKGFAKLGGVINFFSKDDRLYFEINPRAAKEQGISLSSRLLKLAHIVDGQK